jgi:hypothetical protein
MPAALPRSRHLPSHEAVPGALASSRGGALLPAGRPAQLPRVFTGASNHRLDLSSHCFRRTNRGRAHPCDFCRWLSQRARPRTTRTSRATETAVETTAWARSEVAFRSRRPPEVLEVRGRAKPMPDIPGRDCSRRRLGPNPVRSGHLVSQDAVPHRSGATRGEVALPAPTALARSARRQGGVAPGLREEIRR